MLSKSTKRAARTCDVGMSCAIEILHPTNRENGPARPAGPVMMKDILADWSPSPPSPRNAPVSHAVRTDGHTALVEGHDGRVAGDGVCVHRSADASTATLYAFTAKPEAFPGSVSA